MSRAVTNDVPAIDRGLITDSRLNREGDAREDEAREDRFFGEDRLSPEEGPRIVFESPD